MKIEAFLPLIESTPTIAVVVFLWYQVKLMRNDINWIKSILEGSYGNEKTEQCKISTTRKKCG